MEVYLKVIDKLEVPNKNTFEYLHLEAITPKSDDVLKLSFNTNIGNQELILVKTKKNPYLGYPQKYREEYMAFPILSIDYSGGFYTVFKEDLRGYHFQDNFDSEHTKLIMNSFAKLHGHYLSNSVPGNNRDFFRNFLQCLENSIQEFEANLTGDKNDNLKPLKVEFYKILKTLETTMDQNSWVPITNQFNKNPVFFKYDGNNKPIDFKILISNSGKYVPALYDILIFLFNNTTEETRKEFLQEFLQLYYNTLKKETGKRIFDLEQFNFQIKSFIPLVRLSKFIFCMKQGLNGNECLNNLQELSEFLHCPNLLREECYEILKNYLGHTKYNLQKFTLTPLQYRYGNLGDYFKLKANIDIDNKAVDVNLFVKFLPSNNETTREAARNGPSKKEDFFYNFFIKEFENCGLKDLLDFAPTCFLSKTNYVLVLEDLGIQGYSLFTEEKFYSYEMLKLSVTKLARLHACSLVFEETKSKELKESFRLDEHYEDYLQEIIFQTKERDMLRILSEVGEDTVIDYLIPLYREVAKNLTIEEFQKRARITFKCFFAKVLKSDTYRNTLCHGDTWDTNIMFKFDRNNVPTECKFVDYQMTRYCPPIQDVMSHLYLTTNRDTRTKYLSILLDLYYEELSRIVVSFGFDMEKVLSADEFQRSCYYMKSQGICQALFYAQINLCTFEERASIFSDPEKFEQILMKDRRPFIEELIKRHAFYKPRLGEWIQDLYEICENEQY